MTSRRPEPVQVVKRRRDQALSQLVATIPYIGFLDVGFWRLGDELTAELPFSQKLVGNPDLPALHGGAIGAFLEITAVIELAWSIVWAQIEERGVEPEVILNSRDRYLPKTIDFSVDYLRSGLPRDAYARAQVNRSGRRYASVHVRAWQDNFERPFAQATGHFLMPKSQA